MKSITENGTLMKEARQALSGKWGTAILAFLVYGFAIGGSSFTGIGPFILTGPMMVGLSMFFLNYARNQKAEVGQIFKGFNAFGTAFGAYILSAILIVIGMLCLIIPGIIISYMLSQIYFIIADEPTIGPVEALKKSRAMMDGNKGKLFGLHLRFFGWSLLCLLTLGIGFLWLFPYMYVSLAKFYEEVSGVKETSTNDINAPVTIAGLSNVQSPSTQQSPAMGMKIKRTK